MMSNEPLLQAYWADIEAAAAAKSAGLPVYPSISDIQKQYPDQVIRFLKEHGIKKLGETRLPASELQRLFAGATFITQGSIFSSLRWEADWGIRSPGVETAFAADSRRAASAEDPPTSRGGEGSWVAPWGRRNALVRTADDARGWTSSASLQDTIHGGGSNPLNTAAAVGSVTAVSGKPRGVGSLWGPTPPPRLLLPCPPLLPHPSVVVEAYVIAVRDAAAPGEAGLLRPLLRRWQLGSCSASAFALPVVQAVVQYKWTRFARQVLLQQLCAYTVWLGSFTAFMMLFNSRDAAISDVELLSTWKGRLAVACEVLALIGMLPFAAAEVCVMLTYGLWGWLSAWNLLDCTTYGLQLAITVLHLGIIPDGPFWLTTAVAVQAILLVVRLTYFSRVFQATTFDFMGSLQTVISEVGWYMAVLLLLMWGFACAFFTFFREDTATDSFTSLPMSIITMFNYAVGGTSYYMRGLVASEQPAAAVVLCIVYQFLVSMLLMSLLTGVMTNALMKASQKEAVALVLNRAQVIDELETVLPQAVLRLLTPYGRTTSHCGAASDTDRSGSGDGFDRYVHVLRINPRSLDCIDGEECVRPVTASGSGRGAGGSGGGGLGFYSIADAVAGGKAGPSSGGDPAGQHSAMEQLEVRVRRMEQQLEGVVQQMLELNTNVRQLVAQQRSVLVAGGDAAEELVSGAGGGGGAGEGG